MYGPPGCGKTLLARALAAESGANVILVRGPEILSKWLGESEKAVRDIFRKAKASSPCVIIFDELDSLAQHRDNSPAETLPSQMLTEIEEGTSAGVVVIGVTSRPDMLDQALLRTGRLDIPLYVGPPDEPGRLEIIQILVSKMPLAEDVNLQEIAISTHNYTGADLASLCREAAIRAMRKNSERISGNDFAQALNTIKPSITSESREWYDGISHNITNAIPKKVDKVFYG